MFSFTFIIHNSHERKKNHSRFSVVLAHKNPFFTGKKNKTLLVRFELTLYLLYVTSPASNPLYYSGRY